MSVMFHTSEIVGGVGRERDRELHKSYIYQQLVEHLVK